MHSYLELLLAKTAKEVGMIARRQPSATKIARRAHELYVQRGGEHGRDVEDWVSAEKELSDDESVVGSAITRAARASLRAVN
jgi:hypothetical protein